jgi:hypothetical protein
MAIIYSSIAYSGKNKIGTMVLRSVKGQLIASQYQPSVHNPKSAGQTEQRERLKVTVQSYKWVRNIIETLTVNPNKHGSKYNKYVQNNVDTATTYTNGMAAIDPHMMVLSKGSLSNIEGITYTWAAGRITFTYSGASYANQYNANDVIYGYVFMPTIEDSFIVEITTRGVNGTAEINLTGVTFTNVAYIGVAAVNFTEKQTNNSQYLGEIFQ